MLQWTGFAATALMLTALIASIWWQAAWSGDSMGLVVGTGAAFLFVSDPSEGFLPITGTNYTNVIDIERWRYYGFWPRYGSFSALSWFISVPILIPLVLVGTPTIWLWCRDRRRPAPGKCRCGYDLTGNSSGVCPECGLPIRPLV